MITNPLSVKINIPIGNDYSVAHYLKTVNLRSFSFPFDWCVIPVNSAIKLIENDFDDFLDKENLVFLPPCNRMLFSENGVDLKITEQLITPVVDKKYKILFPHDFSEKGELELPFVKEKYIRRIIRLQKILKEKSPTNFIYNIIPINDWQSDQFKLAKVRYPQHIESDIDIKNILTSFNNASYSFKLNEFKKQNKLLIAISKIKKRLHFLQG
jgi:hypothetical protein